MKKELTTHEKSIFANLPHHLIFKILDEHRFEKERIEKENRINKAKIFGLHLEFNRHLFYMWNQYDDFRFKPYDTFIEEDFNLIWLFARIRNSKLAGTDSSEEEDYDDTSSDDDIMPVVL